MGQTSEKGERTMATSLSVRGLNRAGSITILERLALNTFSHPHAWQVVGRRPRYPKRKHASVSAEYLLLLDPYLYVTRICRPCGSGSTSPRTGAAG